MCFVVYGVERNLKTYLKPKIPLKSSRKFSKLSFVIYLKGKNSSNNLKFRSDIMGTVFKFYFDILLCFSNYSKYKNGSFQSFWDKSIYS